MFKSIFSVFILLAAFTFSSTAQKSFTGSINYKITYPSGAGGPMAAALPSNIEMQIAGNKAKFELTLPNGKQTIIVNGDEMTVTRLMDIKEGKFFIKKTKEEIMQGVTPVTVPLTETKTVAGYKCKSAQVSATEKGGSVQKNTVFYSEELGTNNIYFNTTARQVKGILLDFDYNLMGMGMQMTAVDVKPGRISNKNFEIPSEYQETTEAKLQQLRQASRKK